MKLEDIDDDSDSIFFEDPLDEVEESAEDYHNELNPKLWDNMKLKPEVKNKLNEIAKAFIDYLDINDDAIEDIVITGSSAGYNYTPYSDLDLHLVIDYDKVHEDCPIVEGFLWSMKAQFNKDHDISIYGIPVELYAEQSGAGTIHNGLYSLMQNRWIDEPKKIVPPDNDAAVEAKYNELKEAADKIEDSEVAKELLNKIYTMRKAGLAQGGELSTENLAFKKLRNDGTIEKLKQMEKEQIDKELSLEDFSEDPLDEIDESISESTKRAFSKAIKASNITGSLDNEYLSLSNKVYVYRLSVAPEYYHAFNTSYAYDFDKFKAYLDKYHSNLFKVNSIQKFDNKQNKIYVKVTYK